MLQVPLRGIGYHDSEDTLVYVLRFRDSSFKIPSQANPQAEAPPSTASPSTLAGAMSKQDRGLSLQNVAPIGQPQVACVNSVSNVARAMLTLSHTRNGGFQIAALAQAVSPIRASSRPRLRKDCS